MLDALFTFWGSDCSCGLFYCFPERKIGHIVLLLSFKVMSRLQRGILQTHKDQVSNDDLVVFSNHYLEDSRALPISNSIILVVISTQRSLMSLISISSQAFFDSQLTKPLRPYAICLASK